MMSSLFTSRIFSSTQWLLFLGGLAALAIACHGQTLYDFGNPTAEEQQYIELINRARANPPAEGILFANTTDPDILAAYAYFSVNLTMMQSEFNAIAAQPPLAPNAGLTTAARGHSNWMLANSTQAHNETNPANTPSERITAAGYNWTTVAENIYATAQNVWYGHAGFEVDWGANETNQSTGGMQGPPRGHRTNIHSANYREIGVGVTLGTNGVSPNNVGPQLVTQDFGTSMSSPYFGTGVAYYDLNANNTYDAGEGIAGLTVNVNGAGVTQYCTTAIGGGWVVPIPSTATTRTVTFSGLNMNQTASLVVPASKNAKADLKLSYSPPAITSPATASPGIAHSLTFTALGGATAYKWNRWTTSAAAADNCDSTATITAATTGTYSVQNTSVVQQGSGSFHLENSTGANQTIQLNTVYYGQSLPSLAFQSQIHYATSAEFFKVQVKEEGGTVWQDVYSQVGTNSYAESDFTLRTASIGSMLGKAFRVRFLLNSTGSYYANSGDIVGWFIDAISFTGVDSLENQVTQTLAGTSGSFTPIAGTYLMTVAPVISNRDFPASYQTLTVTNKPVASVTLGSLAATYDGSPHAATATTTPVGLAVTFTYDGSTTVPTNAGSYAVVGTISDANYQGSASGTLVISKGTATVTLGSLAATYNGNPHSATATTSPAGLTVTFTYDGSATAPINAGTYAVVGTISDTNYQGSASSTLVISKAAAIVTLGSLAAGYDGSPHAATATTSPAGLTVTFTYDGSATAPTNAGSYAVVGTISDTNYQGNASGTLVIASIPVILSQPISTTIAKNTGTTITVVASGSALTYQWYRGTAGTTTNPISGATGTSYTTPTLTSNTNYWVRVTNAAGFVNSKTSAIKVTTGTVTRTFATWAAEIETANNLSAGQIANAQTDYDRDGRTNLIEYAFGTSPIIANDPAPRMPVALTDATYHVMQYQRDTALTDLTFTPQACADLGTWKAPGEAGTLTGFTDALISTSGTIQTRQAKVPRTSSDKVFIRMRVTQQ